MEVRGQSAREAPVGRQTQLGRPELRFWKDSESGTRAAVMGAGNGAIIPPKPSGCCSRASTYFINNACRSTAGADRRASAPEPPECLLRPHHPRTIRSPFASEDIQAETINRNALPLATTPPFRRTLSPLNYTLQTRLPPKAIAVVIVLVRRNKNRPAK